MRLTDTRRKRVNVVVCFFFCACIYGQARYVPKVANVMPTALARAGHESAGRQFVSTTVVRLRPTCGVITTILEVNEAVVHIVRNLNVSLIVIGDHKTNHSEWVAFQSEHANVVLYLSPDAQNGLPFRTLRHVPWNHFGRKSIGFLYAIAGGRERIYDFDDTTT